MGHTPHYKAQKDQKNEVAPGHGTTDQCYGLEETTSLPINVYLLHVSLYSLKNEKTTSLNKTDWWLSTLVP
jgi:hypothetical protein